MPTHVPVRPTTPPGAAGAARDAAAAVLLGALGLAACWAVMALAGPLVPEASDGAVPTETRPWRVLQASGVTTGVLVALLAASTARRLLPQRGRWVPTEVVVLGAASALLSAAALAALRGTAWGFDGLYSDAGFRTQSVTRYTSSPALADYAYRDLTAYYPPLWPWLQGRAADLLGVAGWQVMKPAQVAVCLVVVPLSWLLWRRVVRPGAAAWVAASVAVVTAIPNKPDEWLVLCLLLPWWLEVCRGLRRPDVAPAGVLRHGVVLGLLLLCHTYFFAPLAIATALGMLLDLLARRPLTPRWPGALAIGAVGLLVATPTWWHLAVARLEGLPTDDLQRRWSPVGFDVPPLPVPDDARGLLGVIAVVWLVVAVRRCRLAAELLLVLLTAVTFVVVGQLLQPWGLAVLPEKSSELVEATYAAAAVLAVRAAGRSRSSRPGRRSAVEVAGVCLVAVVAVALAAQSVGRGMFDPARPALSMRYPDGDFPAGGPEPASPRWHPWGVLPGSSGPSVEEIDRAWRQLSGRGLGAGDVLLSARADVAATLPVHLFVSWKSIYSHPNAEFERRVAELRTLERCDDAECAWRLLRGSDLGAVDGLVLNTDGKGPYLTVTTDDFPDAWERERISVDRDLLRAPWFEVEEISGVLVARVAERP